MMTLGCIERRYHYLVSALCLSLSMGAWIAGCNTPPPLVSSSDQPVIGQCTRIETALRGPAIECTIDAMCPCGSYCDTPEHTCKFVCMVPPGSPAESCASGTQCDDTGKCVSPAGTPPSPSALLTTSPAATVTAPGGAAQILQVHLAVYSAAAVTANQTTPVRAIGEDGAQVSCDSTTFVQECVLNSWSFSFDGTRYNASRTLSVRTTVSTLDGHGEVHLRVDTTASDVLVPVSASSTSSNRPGKYHGTATSPGVPTGLPITAKVRGNFMIVRDPTRTIAPDGSLVLDLLASGTTPPQRRVTWLRPPGATTGGGIVAKYPASDVQFTPATGALSASLRFQMLGGYMQWNLALTKTSEDVAECTANSDCASDETCPAAVQACVSKVSWNNLASAYGDQFDDPRSAQWWDAMDDVMGTGDVVSATSNAAFATTGANMIESLMCTTATASGHLGVNQIMNDVGPSNSGDLACLNDTGELNLSPGAIGLATRLDRHGSAPSAALLAECLQDMARPVTASFTANFDVNTGDCVNLARTLPALRLLSTGELLKQTSVANSVASEYRLQDLFRRLLQQWSELHGFIASAGLSERQYEDAIAATPDDARQGLLSLLDIMDAGWSALLDKRVEPVVETVAASAAGSDQALFTRLLDYRLEKKPVVYWPFTAGAGANRDLMQGVVLTSQQPPCTNVFCTPPPDTCLILSTRNSIRQDFNCPGFMGTLPATSPSIAAGGNLSVVFNVDPIDKEFPPYGGGTILATETLAVFEYWQNSGPTLVVVHPTGTDANGIKTTEWTSFTGFQLGHWTSGTTGDDGTSVPWGTSVAVVRDATNRTYTLYLWNALTATGNSVPGIQSFTKSYQSAVTGALDHVLPRQIMVGAGPWTATTDSWWTQGVSQYRSAYASFIDDVAIFDSMLSQREFVRFASARNYTETRRDVWPQDMTLIDYGAQDLNVPIATAILEAQSAHLELADRLAIHMRYEAQAACDSQDATALADIATIVARLGRTLRQSVAIDQMVALAGSDSSTKDRIQLHVKMSQLIRSLTTLTSCRNPYGMGDSEVPLYFGSVSPQTSETDAFFAASDTLLKIAGDHVSAAQAALTAVRDSWNNARQSQIQALQDSTAKGIRIDELTTKYGSTLIALCGISDQTPAQIMLAVNAGTFPVNTCFILPPGANNHCATQNTTGPVMDADPSCYRGALGAAVIDMNTAYHAHQAAYQTWQAAIANTQSADRLCIQKEMDVYGCSALDRHALSGVTCPPGFQGTIALIEQFNADMIAAESEKSWFDAVVNTVSAVASGAATGGAAGFFGGAAGLMKPISEEMSNAMDDRKRQHDAMLEERSLIDQVRTCWSQAEQYDRAVAAAEQASLEAASRMTSASLTFANGIAQAQETLAEAPIAIGHEQARLSIPIAFDYWLPATLEDYQRKMDTARRYTYMALRATEYDMQDSYAQVQNGKPSRGAVLGAWLPTTLSDQISKMHDQTGPRTTKGGRRPTLGHMTFDLGAKFFGLTEGSTEFGATLASYVKPVYSTHGEYLGLGVKFSLVPTSDDDQPTRRCAERIWRVNVGSSGLPIAGDGVHVKLLKRNLFASRRCDGDGFQVATLRPGDNLLVAAGDPGVYAAEDTTTPADVAVVNFDGAGDPLLSFRTQDTFLNGSSSELSLREMYGDYTLLFPVAYLSSGLNLSTLHDFNLRFDFLSVDDTPPTSGVRVLLR